MSTMPNSSCIPAAYSGSANPSRRAKQTSTHPLDELLSDSESEAGQDSDRDSDFHPGLDVVATKTTSPRSRGASTSATSNPAMPSIPRHSCTGAVPILPKKDANAAKTDTSGNVPQPSRRGRKPSGLSRSAREAQRKLNHSIIEKARRTKINEALATLRELVPSDYGRSREEEDEDEGTDVPGKKGGKKEKKEKEFKLEILVRTVSFMKDLLEKVRVLESQQGIPTLDEPPDRKTDGKKRKHLVEESSEHDFSDHYEERRQRKKLRTDTTSPLEERHPRSSISQFLNGPPRFNTSYQRRDSHSGAIIPSYDQEASTSYPSAAAARLPSISSWLSTVTTAPLDSPVIMPTSPTFHATPDAYIDPTLRAPGSESHHSKALKSALRHHSGMSSFVQHSSYLPSPPPSTRIPALLHGTTHDAPSALDLGEAYDIDTSHASTKDGSPSRTNFPGPRTPDEDSAASMLLEISASFTSSTSGSPGARTVPSTSAERLSVSPPSLSLTVSPSEVQSTTTGSIVHGVASDGSHFNSPRPHLGPSTPKAQLSTNVKPIVCPPTGLHIVDPCPSEALIPQTPSSLLGMGGVERVMSRLGLGARIVAE